jgi:peptidoglycan/LPS O-acetylase OafA/YrhL
MNTPENCSPDLTQVRSDAAEAASSAISGDRKNNNFNFLRLLLAVLVILAHSPELVDGTNDREILTQIFHTETFGSLAVNGFFALSGYLILQSWWGNPQPFDFLKKRILRIYPGFVVASLLSAFVFGPMGARAADYFAQFNFFEFIKEMLLLRAPSVPPVFAGSQFPVVNGSLFTIEYEFRCYLLVAVFGISGILRRRRLWLALTISAIALSIASDLVRNVSFPGEDLLISDPGWFVKFLSFFSAGGCFYLFRDRIRYKPIYVLVALPAVILSMFTWESSKLILPTLGAYIFFGFAFTHLPILQEFGTHSDISYGVYLYAWPTQKLLLWYFPSLSPWLLFVLACGISFACGLLSWHLVERPFLRLKPSRKIAPVGNSKGG